MPKRLRVAEIGLGWVGTHRHLPAMKAHGGFDVVGVIDRHPGTAERVARERGIPRFHVGDDLLGVPWLDEVEALVVATAPFTHYSLISAALHAGKHVLTEKPFVMTIGEGEALVNLAGRQQLVLGIVHNFQFARSTRRLLHDIGTGALGRITGIIAQQYRQSQAAPSDLVRATAARVVLRREPASALSLASPVTDAIADAHLRRLPKHHR